MPVKLHFASFSDPSFDRDPVAEKCKNAGLSKVYTSWVDKNEYELGREQLTGSKVGHKLVNDILHGPVEAYVLQRVALVDDYVTRWTRISFF